MAIEQGHVARLIPRLALDIGKRDNPGAGAMVALRAKRSLAMDEDSLANDLNRRSRKLRSHAVEG